MVDADAPYSLGRPSTTRKSPPLQSPQRMLSDHRNHTFHLSCQTIYTKEIFGLVDEMIQRQVNMGGTEVFEDFDPASFKTHDLNTHALRRSARL